MTVGEIDYSVERTFESAVWYPQKSVVSYNESYAYTPSSESSLNTDDTIFTVNLGAYDVWYQMVNKPKYFKAW